MSLFLMESTHHSLSMWPEQYTLCGVWVEILSPLPIEAFDFFTFFMDGTLTLVTNTLVINMTFFQMIKKLFFLTTRCQPGPCQDMCKLFDGTCPQILGLPKC
jgi:hypothetical protein